jgi:hypothetical protein
MKELFDEANNVVLGRNVWEQKQRLYYEMRHDGIRRRSKPWPGAADMHFPLIDMTIGKSKPFWGSQALGAERLCSFVALKEQLEATTTAAADFFDFELKQNSNFQPELIRSIDTLLMRGRGVLKVTVDPFQDYRIVCEEVDPLFIIMADGADDFEDADWFVHVMHLTVGSYKRNRRYEQDPDVIKRIVGMKETDDTSGYLQRVKEIREGINFTGKPNQILLWEHYVKTMGGWTVYSYSPLNPQIPLRRPHGVPYKFGGKISCPFYSWKTEIKDKGWYSPRGLAETNRHFEQYACKLWNEKTDAMTFANRPVFTTEQAIPNTANLRWHPGEFIPGNARQVQVAPPAFSFDQEIAFTRSVAEQRSKLPDFGITQPGGGQGESSPRTATENNRISTLQTVATDFDGKIFRMDLARCYRHIWGLMLQFKRANLSYYAAGELKTIPEQALHDAYLITPDGSPDQWNKQLRVQRAQQRLGMFKGAPNVDQDVLVRDALAADDPKFALEAFIPSDVKAGSEAEDEAVEISIMKDGFPAQVKPNEDHVTRIHVLMGWLQKQSMSGAPVDPVAQQRVQQHLVIHWQYLKQTQPEAARALLQEVAQREQGGGPGQAGGQPPPMGGA